MNKLFFILLFFTLSAGGQAKPQYELRGIYLLKNSHPVEYGLTWTETKGNVEGEYRDNYFAPSARVKGTSGKHGRSFTVTLNEKVRGAKTINLLTAMPSQNSGAFTLPVSVVVRDGDGTPLSSFTADAKFYQQKTNRIAQEQEALGTCEDGFGELAGFCGYYSGMVSEDQDRTNSCDLSSGGSPVLELSTEGELRLHLGPTPSLVTRPLHDIGRVPVNPGVPEVDILSRKCRPLPGINWDNDACKILNMRGVFSRTKKSMHFGGTYTITNEKTNRTCMYQLSLDLR